MLASASSKTATMRKAPITSGHERKASLSNSTSAAQWSRSARYTLRVPLMGREISTATNRIRRQVETVLFLPSNSYRSLHDFEQEACNAIFGALYQQGERTNFAMYADLEIVFQVQDCQSGYLSPKCERRSLDEQNWDEILELVLSGEAKKVELRANWWRSRGSGRVSNNILTTQTPSSFPVRKSMDQMSAALPSPGKTSGNISPRRSDTMSSRGSVGSDRVQSPVSRVDSGHCQQIDSPK